MSCWKSLLSCASPRRKTPKDEIPLTTQAQTGLKLLSAGTEPTIDIIAVHGLGGDRDKSWTTTNGANWLKDFLPEDLPYARIYSWGHNATNQDKSYPSQPGGPPMQSISERLIVDLWDERERTNTHHHSIILIAHSLGGTIVKSALLYSDSHSTPPNYRTIRKSTYGIFYMGTPELDSRMTGLDSYLTHHASEPEKQTDSYKEAHWLMTKLREYAMISEDFQTVYVYEMLRTDNSTGTNTGAGVGTGSGRTLQLSPRTNKPPINTYTISIDADHVNMIKFESASHPSYMEIRDYMKAMARYAGEQNVSDSSQEEGDGYGYGEGLGLSIE